MAKKNNRKENFNLKNVPGGDSDYQRGHPNHYRERLMKFNRPEMK